MFGKRDVELNPRRFWAWFEGEAQGPEPFPHPAGVLGVQGPAQAAAARRHGGQQESPVGGGFGARDPDRTQGLSRRKGVLDK